MREGDRAAHSEIRWNRHRDVWYRCPKWRQHLRTQRDGRGRIAGFVHTHIGSAVTKRRCCTPATTCSTPRSPERGGSIPKPERNLLVHSRCWLSHQADYITSMARYCARPRCCLKIGATSRTSLACRDHRQAQRSTSFTRAHRDSRAMMAEGTRSSDADGSSLRLIGIGLVSEPINQAGLVTTTPSASRNCPIVPAPGSRLKPAS